MAEASPASLPQTDGDITEFTDTLIVENVGRTGLELVSDRRPEAKRSLFTPVPSNQVTQILTRVPYSPDWTRSST